MKCLAAGFAGLTLIALAACGDRPEDYPLVGDSRNAQPPLFQAAMGGTFVALSFSGGGSRAALLDAAVTNELSQLEYQTQSGPRRLSDDIAVVSSVSGGSVYAGYLGIYGTRTPGHTPADFEEFIAGFDGMSYLYGRALNPLTWIGLAAADKTRTAVLEDMIAIALGPDGKTPTTATLASIERPDRPSLLLNASDIVSGQVFTFDTDTLNDLCQSKTAFPVNVAVAASAAFPVGFTPVLLRNNSLDTAGHPVTSNNNDACRRPPPGDWINATNSLAAPYTDLETYRHAVARAAWRGTSLANGLPPRRTPVYVRLADGGVADNLGLTSLRRALLAQTSPVNLTGILAKMPPGMKLPLILIEVNARSDPKSNLDTSPAYTTILQQAGSDSGTLVDSAAASSGVIFQNFVLELERSLAQTPLAGRVAIYPMQIDFDRLPDVPSSPDDNPNNGRNLVTYVKNVATSWTLAKGDRHAIDIAVQIMLAREPCYAKLYADLRLTGGVTPTPVAGTSCKNFYDAGPPSNIARPRPS
jgi:NTE family protein